MSSWHQCCFTRVWITHTVQGKVLTGRRTCLTLVGLALTTQLVSARSAIAATQTLVQGDFVRLADTAHLEFKGLKSWRYDLQKDGPKKITLSVPAMDAPSVVRLKSFTDPLVTAVDVNTHGADGSYLVTFTLGQSDVETFDYLTDEPSRLIIDFYKKAEPEAKKPQVAKDSGKPLKKVAAKRKSVASAGKTSEYQEVKLGRKPAGDEFLTAGDEESPETETPAEDQDLHFGIFDGGDENYDRFRIKDYEVREEAVISSRQNIYLPFPMLKMNVSQLAKLVEQQPEYVIHPKDSRENKEARLLQALFNRKRFAVFLKTYNYFMKKYPDSEYAEILKNMAAAVHLANWQADAKPYEYDMAKALYNELVQKFPSSPLREHNYLILGFMQLERGDALATLQTFQGFESAYPHSADIPQVRKALAESYMPLRRYDEATAEYNSIIKDFPNTVHAQEARYRLGDVAFAKADYSGAIRLYESALKELPAQEKVFPNADFNMAEARFWQKDFRKALNGYVQFVNLYPTHDFGGYALTRIGELLNILGADQRRVMGAYLESYFRFPNHPGAKVARIRMLSQQMRGMKDKENKKALEEIDEIANKLDLPGIKEFTTLMTAEGLTNRGDYKAALEKLIAYYQVNPSSDNLESFKGRILRNVANEMKDQVDKGEFMKALQFYSQYQKTWLKNSDRIDVPFFLGQAYERAGAYPEAEKIYKETLARRERIAGTDIEKEKKVQEHLPSVDNLHLRLASALAEDRDYMEAYQHLKAIGKGEDLSPEQTIERVQLSAEIAEQRNDPKRAREALTELSEKWKGDPALVAPVNLQLAQTFMKLGNASQAEVYADRVLKAEGGETILPEKVLADAYNVKGDAELKQKKAMAAVETYQKLLERFEAKLPLANVRYQVGQILFERGDLKGAADVWKRLEGTPNEFLWKIGKEKLEDTKWRDEYHKYISRIPAMEAP